MAEETVDRAIVFDDDRMGYTYWNDHARMIIRDRSPSLNEPLVYKLHYPRNDWEKVILEGTLQVISQLGPRKEDMDEQRQAYIIGLWYLWQDEPEQLMDILDEANGFPRRRIVVEEEEEEEEVDE